MNLIQNLISDMIEHAQPFVVRVQSGGRGVGTGIVWRSNTNETDILTNQHVVAHTKNIRVELHDGREANARVVTNNAELDLALLRIATPNLACAPVAHSAKLRVGEWVFAIGNPWGVKDVVTHGIVSSLGKVQMRNHPNAFAEYVRSDVQLAPGNSGGPLLNVRGEVVGINAMIFGGDLSVAIPVHAATQWLLRTEKTQHAEVAV